MALTRLPFFVLRAFATAPCRRLAEVFSPVWKVDGFVPFGCDGTRIACPRVGPLEERLANDGKSDTPPQVWVTALVHLRLGLLWAWTLGKADANERQHLHQLLPTLPGDSLVITDAGYQGYELAAALGRPACVVPDARQLADAVAPRLCARRGGVQRRDGGLVDAGGASEPNCRRWCCGCCGCPVRPASRRCGW